MVVCVTVVNRVAPTTAPGRTEVAGTELHSAPNTSHAMGVACQQSDLLGGPGLVLSATEADILAYLERVQRSGVLGRSARRPALLEYLLLAEIRGEGGNLKAYSIGLDIFEKKEDFDPTTDSSVRVEIGRLRTALALFEAGEFADTQIMVNLPVGTYRPEITLREAALPSPSGGTQNAAQNADKKSTTRRSSSAIPSFAPARALYWVAGIAALAAVLLFAILGGRWFSETSPPGPPILLSVEDFYGDELGRELSTMVKDSFANNDAVSVGNFAKIGPDSDYFGVTGNVTTINDVVWIGVELANKTTGEVVWSHVFDLDLASDLKLEIDTKLNGELETRLIGAAKRLLERRDVEMLSPQQLFILGTWVSGPAVSSLDWEAERVTLMKLALDKDPDFGPAHSVLADKYGFLANMHPDWDTDESLRLSRFHAERAIELSPLDSNAMFNVAQSFWHAGRHAESQRVFRRVTELDGGNSLARFFARVVPYWCDEVPDEIMDWAIAFDNKLSQDDPIRWIVLTWIATLHTNRGEYNLALQAATDASRIFQVGYTYMLHSMLLNKIGRTDAAQAAVERQYGNWPGIDAAQYAGSSIPRLCTEQGDPEPFIKDYSELATALQARE